MAKAGMVLGIVSLLCSTLMTAVIPKLIFAAPLSAGVGLPLSWVAFRRTRMYATSSSDVPLVTLAINVVALGFIIV